MTKTTLPYIQWQPAVTPEQVFADYIGLGKVWAAGEKLYWLEIRPAEGGRTVLVQRDGQGHIQDITPEEYYIRSRVHEYGGGALALQDNTVVFVNFKDQRLYRQVIGQAPVALTPAPAEEEYLNKYGGLDISTDRKYLVFVWEKEHQDPSRTINLLGTLDLTTGKVTEPVELISGSDFYSAPRLSPIGDRIAWASWDFPYMPWDSTELFIADFENGRIVEASITKVAGGHPFAILSYQFAANGDLLFTMDRAGCRETDPGNWSNIYHYSNGRVEAVTTGMTEYGVLQWQLGVSNMVPGPTGSIAAVEISAGNSHLQVIDPESKAMTEVETSLDAYGNLSYIDRQTLALIGSSRETVASVGTLDLNTGEYREIRRASHIEMNPADISQGRHISYPSTGGATGYGYLYLPKNSNYAAPENDKPPLIVMAHGGPTARTSAASLSLTKQFWTTQGYAILDVDYRGSNGYGRAYRDLLLGQWGVADAEDIANGVRYLVGEGLVDPSRIAITGGSAGGYAVQRALTLYPELFHSGASYFGIGNLETLARLTHKFESRYLDLLIGRPYTEGDPVYRDRSPINHLDRLQAPMILFQGADDRIVPPETSREMKRILDDKGLRCEYIEYAGEGHGFRSKTNNIDALNREAAFYREVFSVR